MADPISVQLLAFNFVSRTVAYQRLARGLNRSATGFSARNYFEPCLSANVCTQFTDDTGCGVQAIEHFIPNLRIFSNDRKLLQNEQKRNLNPTHFFHLAVKSSTQCN